MRLGFNGKPLTKRAVHMQHMHCGLAATRVQSSTVKSRVLEVGQLGQQGHGCRLQVLQMTAEPLAECQQGFCKGSARVLQGFAS